MKIKERTKNQRKNDLNQKPKITGRRAREEARVHLAKRADRRDTGPGQRRRGRVGNVPHVRKWSEEGAGAGRGDGEGGEGEGEGGGDEGESFFFSERDWATKKATSFFFFIPSFSPPSFDFPSLFNYPKQTESSFYSSRNRGREDGKEKGKEGEAKGTKKKKRKRV